MRKITLCLCLLLCLILSSCAAKDAATGDAGPGLIISADALTGEVSFFDYNAGGTAMQVIARVDDAGVPKLSYNTCQSCAGSPYAYFEAQNGRLVCRNCGNVFSYDTIGETRTGGCMPIAVEEYTVENGVISISAETLNGMKTKFVNWKKGL